MALLQIVFIKASGYSALQVFGQSQNLYNANVSTMALLTLQSYYPSVPCLHNVYTGLQFTECGYSLSRSLLASQNSIYLINICTQPLNLRITIDNHTEEPKDQHGYPRNPRTR
jgi:hypothetical protein